MKVFRTYMCAGLLALVLVAMQGCSFSTANMSSLKTATDKEGKKEASSFKAGDTLYGLADISNNPGKVKVKFALVAEDVKGMTKGETLKGSDVTYDMDGSGVAIFSVPVAGGFPGGTYKLNADMINEAGEKKDSKSTTVTVVAAAAPAGEPE